MRTNEYIFDVDDLKKKEKKERLPLSSEHPCLRLRVLRKVQNN